MTLANALSQLPDDTRCSLTVGSGDMTVGELRDALASDEAELLSVSQAHARWPAYSKETWRRAAAEGEVRGAWQDVENGPWRLPARSCEEYVAARQSNGSRRGSKGPRGPRSWYLPAARGRAKDLQTDPVLDGRSPAVRRIPGRDQGPEAPELAG